MLPEIEAVDDADLEAISESMTPSELLDRLNDPLTAPAERLALILRLETVDIPHPLLPRELSLLREHILQQRDAMNATEITAAASAVRTYVSELPVADLGSLAELLERDGDVPHIAVELEICKMIVRKLAACPPSNVDAFPVLANTLVEVVASCSPR